MNIMPDRCAICAEDGHIANVCDRHYWAGVYRHHVRVTGTISDWPPLATGKYPAIVQHAEMQTSRLIADGRSQHMAALDARLGGIGLGRDIRLWAEVGALLAHVQVDMETTALDSLGDGLAIHCRVIPHWLIDSWVMWLEEQGRQAA